MSEQALSPMRETAKYLEAKQTQLDTLLPDHLDPKRFLRVIFLQMQKIPQLAQCSKESIYAGMMSAAEVGLVPDGRQGALIPYRNKGKLEAQFQPMYFGLIDRARQTGELADIYAASIRENDEFTYQLGFDRELIHRPNIRGDRGEIVAVYCVILLKDGTKTFGPGPMTVEEVNAIRARSKAYRNAENKGTRDSPWHTDWEAMAWKTVAKRTLKWVPQSTDDLRGIIDLDNSQYETEAAEPTKPVTINDLMSGQVVDPGQPEDFEQDASGELTSADSTVVKPGSEDITPEWPKWDAERKNWFDADGVYWDQSAHGTTKREGKDYPSMLDDGTFRAKRGYAERAKKLKEAAKFKENATAASQEQESSGSTPEASTAEAIVPTFDELKAQLASATNRDAVDAVDDAWGYVQANVPADEAQAFHQALVAKYREVSEKQLGL